MHSLTNNAAVLPQEQVTEMLHELALPKHRRGYSCLCVGVPRFAIDTTQSMTKELYPYIAKVFEYQDWRAVEHGIRDVIQAAWEDRDPAVWEKYFPNQSKVPSNKQFIATLAERIK